MRARACVRACVRVCVCVSNTHISHKHPTEYSRICYMYSKIFARGKVIARVLARLSVVVALFPTLCPATPRPAF